MLRIASVPAAHVYVRHLSNPDGLAATTLLEDPEPVGGRLAPGVWWPPRMLEPGWVAENHPLFDIFHIHFGFDAVEPAALADLVAELKTRGKPLVYTVHDLRNPHHRDPRAHAEQQDVLVQGADALITLTPGAAEVIRSRWGREAHVLPHPHVFDGDRIDRPRRPADQFVVGVHVKNLRANMDPLPVLAELVGAVAELPSSVLQINAQEEIFEPGNYWHAPDIGAMLLEYNRHDHVRLVVGPYLSDNELEDYLASLSVSVLPYRFGSHSGWLEACFDVGTAVIAPSCGFYAQQRRCDIFDFAEGRFDAATLRAAVHAAHRRWAAAETAPRATWAARRQERAALADAHHSIYRSLRP